MTTKEAYIALNLLPKIGPVRVRKLLDRFETPQNILSAKRDQILGVDGFGSELADLLVQWEERIDLPRELELIRNAKVDVLTPECEGYPPSLREIYDPPSVLYVWGKLTKADFRSIGVVGSRRATHYGLQMAKKLSYQMARAGLTVISGLARGIDTAAHEGALAGGRTVAVLGSGLGKLYPPENQVLAEKIVEQGAVVSEFPILYLPDKQSFPLRNRIVSGWSSGILVIEAPQRSGSLITANQAAEQGRQVYAMPGPIDRPTSQGCHRLIQEGAKLVMGAEDVLEDFGQLELITEEGAPQAPPELSKDEAALYELLSGTEIGIEDLIRQSGLPSQLVATTLMRLEMKRLVKQLPGKHFVKVS